MSIGSEACSSIPLSERDPAQSKPIKLDTPATGNAPNASDHSQHVTSVGPALGGPHNGSPGVVYLSRIPHGFYEEEMRSYFSQFGSIDRLRLCRNKTTGKSKHYAFIQFSTIEVAGIVADTMDNYLLYGHILKCKVLPQSECRESMWIGANRKWKVPPLARLRRLKHERRKPTDAWDKLETKEMNRRLNNAKKWKERGIEYSFGTPGKI